MMSLILKNKPAREEWSAYFTSEKTDLHRGQETCPKPHSKWQSWDWKPGSWVFLFQPTASEQKASPLASQGRGMSFQLSRGRPTRAQSTLGSPRDGFGGL